MDREHSVPVDMGIRNCIKDVGHIPKTRTYLVAGKWGFDREWEDRSEAVGVDMSSFFPPI